MDPQGACMQLLAMSVKIVTSGCISVVLLAVSFFTSPSNSTNSQPTPHHVHSYIRRIFEDNLSSYFNKVRGERILKNVRYGPVDELADQSLSYHSCFPPTSFWAFLIFLGLPHLSGPSSSFLLLCLETTPLRCCFVW